MKTHSKQRKFFSGFTMLELVVTLAILGVAIVLAIPNFLAWRANSNLGSAARQLYASLQHAKIHSIKSKNLCSVVFNQEIDGITYSFVVFDDPATIGNAADELEYNAGETILAKVKFSDYKDVVLDTSKGGGDGITFTNNDSGNPAVAFRPNGLTRSNSGGFGAGSVFLKNNRTSRKIQVTISQAGMIRIDNY